MNREIHEKHEKILYKEESYLIQGAVFEVYREKGQQLVQKYKPDFICYDKIIVEIKAVKEVVSEHKAQLLNYLKATKMELGLLINFGSYPKAEILRMANTDFSRFSRLSRLNNNLGDLSDE